MGRTEAVTILGSSLGACRLAWRAAGAGWLVRLHDPDGAALGRAQASVRDEVAAELAAGRIAAADRQRILDGILTTRDLHVATTHADLVVEAAGLEPPRLRSLLMQLGPACRASAVVAVGGEPDRLVDYLPSPGRLVGLWLASEGTRRAEIAVGRETANHALERARRFAERVGEAAVVIRPSEPPAWP